MSGRISVSPSVLVWAIEESQRDLASIEAQFPKLQLWLTSQADPTFKQLKDLSDYLHVPFGYMFLDTPPKESELIKQFRTINNNQLAQISKDLKDTLSYMQTVSMWMSEHRVEEGEDILPFIGMCSDNPDITTLEHVFLKTLSLKRGFSRSFRDPDLLFKDLRKRMENVGVLVFRNGKVGNNTRRLLDVQEFRAFSLVDNYAPIIFINSRDSQNGQVFSLIHEFIHLLLGEAGATLPGRDESICNQTAVALLMPDDLVLGIIPGTEIRKEDIYNAASSFNVSPLALAIFLYSRHRVSDSMVELIKDEMNKNLELKAKQKSKGGADFYLTFESNTSLPFRLAVANQLREGKETYTAATQLLGLSKSETMMKIIERATL